MKNLITTVIILALLQQGCNNAEDAGKHISGGYIFSDLGEGHNAIYGGSSKIQPINWVKKYSDDGKYICIWQADSSYINSKNFRYGSHPKDTYFPNDKFYIINIKQQELLGPFRVEDFFSKTRLLNIQVKWLPVVLYNP